MTDVIAQVDAVARGLRTEGAEDDALRVQTLTQQYPSPVDDVWDAVTDSARIARWFLPISGELRLGGRYQLEGNAGGEILECSPPAHGAAHYRVTWEFGGGITWLVVRLRAEGDQHTVVELEHSARVADTPPGFWEQFGPGATGVGWDGGMLGLFLHLTNGGRKGPEALPEWPFTPEGRTFYRAAADGWAKAHVAAGADRAVAAAAADATYGFYTGQ